MVSLSLRNIRISNSTLPDITKAFKDNVIKKHPQLQYEITDAMLEYLFLGFLIYFNIFLL